MGERSRQRGTRTQPLALRRQARRIEEGHVASAVVVATLSLAVGLLNAVSIRH
ncbi:MAG TPA: DUF350 domain-containing protein [Steroidobacteraceae bacterium]|jgi:uncharacterized membrane protein YjfL (UPF0719 family)|nr:DUF350 domain-containing protein [Steroidobacteraceae bacterium]